MDKSFYYLWHSSSQQSCEDECQPGASKASGGDNPEGVVRFQDAYSIRNTAQALLARVGYLLIFILFISSLFLHFVALDYPKEAVFDEVHFGKFVSGYFTGEHFFDIHPPLGKLMIAGVGKLTGFKPGFDFQRIGEEYPNNNYIGLRFLPALFGSLLVPLIYLLTFRLSGSQWAAVLAALLLLFENALLVQSKFILIDSFLLFFGFASLYFFLQSSLFFREKPWGMWSCVIAAICAGCALSVKWTAASFWGLILIFGFAVLLKQIINNYIHKDQHERIRKATFAYVILFFLPLLVYIVFFAIHFRLLPNKGPGDAYMSKRFEQSREHGFPAKDFWLNIKELNMEMFRANQRITATHSYSSKWYTWPFMLRPVYFWNKDLVFGSHTAYEKIYFIGNPFVWWLSTIVTGYFFLHVLIKSFWSLAARLIKKYRQTRLSQERKSLDRFTILFLVSAYLFNIIPFIFIGRVMFLYHYLIALVVAIMITAIFLTSRSRPHNVFLIFLMAGMIAGFFVMFPITYGIPLDASWPRSLFWLKSWI